MQTSIQDSQEAVEQRLYVSQRETVVRMCLGQRAGEVPKPVNDILAQQCRLAGLAASFRKHPTNKLAQLHMIPPDIVSNCVACALMRALR